jgi:hypothetical protein
MTGTRSGASPVTVFGPTRVDRLWTVAELAAALGITPDGLRASVRSGAVPEPDDLDTDRPPQRRRPTWSADRARQIVAGTHPTTPQQEQRRAARRATHRTTKEET